MIRVFALALLTSLLLSACQTDKALISKMDLWQSDYDIILNIGQSNTHAGYGLDLALDTVHPLVDQLGRFDGNDEQVIPAVEPLDHHTRTPERIGFALPFARLYAERYLRPERRVLIVPSGFGGTGFIDNRWNKGDDLYEDAVFRTLEALKKSPNSRIVAILWHQGETDLNNANYQTVFDEFISDLRTDLQCYSTPFICGGMVPYWVHHTDGAESHQQVIASTPQRVPHCGYADPELPFAIAKPDDSFDAIHYDAAGMRELGSRYFEVYRSMR